jgi:hypothetical protein
MDTLLLIGLFWERGKEERAIYREIESREREKERERDRQRERQTEREREGDRK